MAHLNLTPAQLKIHRAAAHHLDPVVLIGSGGLTDAVVKEIDTALKAHGLIKLRVLSQSRDERQALLALLADQLNSAAVQHIGKLLVLWRPPQPKEKVPREDRMPGPRTVKIVKFSSSPHHRPTVKKVKVFGNQRVTAGGSIKRARLRSSSVKKRVV